MLNRRQFLRHAARFSGAGLLAPLWKAIAETGEIGRAYPDELLSIEMYTRGRIKPGDVIDAGNVELVKDLLEPAKYHHIANMGRVLRVVETTRDYMKLGPWEYQEATLRNQGQARFDESGNVVTADGGPWIGGNPFPNASTALELFAGITMSWGRHDASLYAVRETDLSAEGIVDYRYDGVFGEYTPVGRLVLDPQPHWQEHLDTLRFNSVIYLSPDTERGTSFLNIWPYDQHQLPFLYGYIPAFQRIRQYPASQRFEPLVPGSAIYLSDIWAAGDPLHTWGNYRVIGRQPLLAGVSSGWNADHPNWERPVHGGPRGESFFDSVVELVPETIVVEAEPIAFTRAPVSRKRVWFDARNQMPVAMVTYDRNGKPFRSFDGCYSLYQRGDRAFMDGRHPYWSWTYLHAYEFQSGRITRLQQVRSLEGHRTSVNDDSIYEKYLTLSAVKRFGRI